MRRVRAILFRLASFVRRERWEQELDAELQSNLELHIEDNVRAGMSREEARRQAILRFGSFGDAKQAYRSQKSLPWIADLARDLGQSSRALWRSKGFSAAVVGIMGLCIGANTTVLSALYAIVLEPLPVRDPDRVVRVVTLLKDTDATSLFNTSSWSQYLDLKKNADFFDGFALRLSSTKTIVEDSSATLVRCHAVSADFFDVMGVEPLLGRFFTTHEVDPGPGRVVVLTQTTWEAEHGADPGVIGRQLRFGNDVPFTIVGVAPRALERFDPAARVLVPYELNLHSRDPQSRYSHGVDLWARLKPGVDREAGLAQIRELERRWYEDVADENGRRRYESVERFALGPPHPLASSLLLLEGGALFLLLIGCLNTAHLFLNRAGEKRREHSIRLALGAGRRDLRRLVLIEGTLLGAAALLAGIALAHWGAAAVKQFLAVLDPTVPPIGLAPTVLGVMLALIAAAIVLMSLLPVEILWRTGLGTGVDASLRASTVGRVSRGVSRWMIVGQIAVAFILLTGAGLLLRSFHNVVSVDPGFEPSRVVQGRVSNEATRSFYAYPETATLRRRVVAAMEKIPGVESVAVSLFEVIQTDEVETRGFVIRGEPPAASHQMIVHFVSPGYFETMGIPILEGRGFDSMDPGVASPAPPIVVDEVFAGRFLGGRGALGAEIAIGDTPPSPGTPWSRVVGVSRRANLQGQEQRDGLPFVYACMDEGGSWGFTVLVRVSRGAEGVARDMQVKLREVDPRLPLSDTGPLQQTLDAMHLDRKGLTWLVAAFAALALVVAAIGVYALLARDVSLRRREIGVRSALGAKPGEVSLMVLRESLGQTVAGLGLGLLVSLPFTHSLQRHLFDVGALDLQSHIIAIGILILAGAAASYLPAHRAARVDPAAVLRAE